MVLKVQINGVGINTHTERYYNIPQGTVVPVGSKLLGEGYYWRNNNQCTTENVNKDSWYNNGFYCTGRVLEEDAMNY